MSQPKSFNEIIQEFSKFSPGTKQRKSEKPKLSLAQLENLNNRLKILLPQYKKAIGQKNLADAKNIVFDLQSVLRTLGKTTKLVEIKNQLFELALDEREYDFAIDGFVTNRTLVSETTRLYLEATALLAIAYLRKKQIEKAKPFIKEVLQNKKVIKTDSTREKFNKEIIARFDEECALFSMGSDEKILIDYEVLHKRVIEVLGTNQDEKQLFAAIGSSLPKSTKDILFDVDKFSKHQLPYKEQKLLPPPEDSIKDEQAGRTVFSALKRVIYKSLCDPFSEVYKAWYTNGVGSVVDKKYITAAVALALTGQGIGLVALTITATAIVMRFGLDIYCERYKPAGVTEFRRKSE